MVSESDRIRAAAAIFQRIAEEEGGDPGLHVGLPPEQVKRMLTSGRKKDLRKLMERWNASHPQRVVLVDHGDEAEVLLGHPSWPRHWVAV
ncbi:MAG: hypothetical protein ACOZNI_22850 [Myxococcota bacterium]